MTAFLVLLLAALSRLFPHVMHGTGYNFTAVGGGLLFFGSRRPRWQALIAIAVLAVTDIYLTTQVYGYPFHVRGYLVTWAWYGGVCLLGGALLHKETTPAWEPASPWACRSTPMILHPPRWCRACSLGCRWSRRAW